MTKNELKCEICEKKADILFKSKLFGYNCVPCGEKIGKIYNAILEEMILNG